MGYKLNLPTAGILGIRNTTVQTIAADTSLSATGADGSAINAQVVLATAADITITLPPVATAQEGQTIQIKNDSNGSITVTGDGTVFSGGIAYATDVQVIFHNGDWIILNNVVNADTADSATTATTATTADQVERFTGQPTPAVQTGDNIKFWTGSETDYDQITPKDPSTLYILTS